MVGVSDLLGIGEKKGHLFTNGLIRSMMYQTKKREAATRESVLKMAEGQVIRLQKPYWEIRLH